MKKYSFIFFIALLAACDDRFNFLATYNAPPVIVMNQHSTSGTTGNTYTMNDSLKISFKHGKNYYDIPVSISDPNNNLTSIDFAVLSGSATVNLNTKPLTGAVPVNLNNYAFQLDNIQEGAIVVNINATDAFHSTSRFVLNLVAFKNLPPVASFTYALSANNGDPYEYILDASNSRDKDQPWGGGIQSWAWTINGKTLPPVTTNQIHFVFPGPGGYQVSLLVYDNDGAPSAIVTKTITVN